MKILPFISFIIIMNCYLFATIINIPDDQQTIQEGIDVAIDGDTVLVQPGTYYENINYNGKNITVASLFLTTQDTTYISETVIDGDNTWCVVTFMNGEDSTAVLVGFIITNGYSFQGGGITCYGSTPQIKNVIITDCHTTEFFLDNESGGGIYCYESSPSLENVTITGNTAFDNGGGIYCWNSSPYFENVIIQSNTASNGGGIYCDLFSNPTLANVVIIDNQALDSGGGIFCISTFNIELTNVDVINNYANNGGGTYIYESILNFDDVTFTNNYAGYNGGGIFVLNCDSLILDEITFDTNYSSLGGNLYVSNSSVIIKNSPIYNGDAFSYGGGIYCNNNSVIEIDNVNLELNIASFGGGIYSVDSDLFLRNSIMSNNSSENGGAIKSSNSYIEIINCEIVNNGCYVNGVLTLGSSNTLIINTTFSDNYAQIQNGGISGTNVTLINSILWDNIEPQLPSNAIVSYSNIQGGWDGEGNINEDPLFVGTGEHQYALQENSPCIDAGTPDTTGLSLPPWDIVGNERIWDGDGDGFHIIDMGAYEYGAPPYVYVDDNVIVHTPEIFLHQNYPNPFNPSTTISFNLTAEYAKNAELVIYNIRGQRVKTFDVTLPAKPKLGEGWSGVEGCQGTVTWNGRDSKGNPVSSGIYFYKLKTGENSIVRKMILLR